MNQASFHSTLPPENIDSTVKPLPRILVVEDERPMRTALSDALERKGYRILTATNGEEGLNKTVQEKPDLLILDVMMPKLDGFALCRELRRLGFTKPILLLTAKGRVEDRVQGLDGGADDYLAKPFSREELLARIRALLRRHEKENFTVSALEFGTIRIDFPRMSATRAEEVLHLTSKEFAMLRLLAEHLGEVVSREQFLDVVWGYTAFPTTRTVDKHMASLRAKLESDPEHPKHLLTVHGAGYKLLI